MEVDRRWSRELDGGVERRKMPKMSFLGTAASKLHERDKAGPEDPGKERGESGAELGMATREICDSLQEVNIRRGRRPMFRNGAQVGKFKAKAKTDRKDVIPLRSQVSRQEPLEGVHGQT